MSTFSELTDSTLLYLSGFSNAQEQATYLTSGVSASDLTLPVADATALSRGLVEIGDELMWVDDVNATALTAVVPPYGRGFRSTTAATHASGSRVVSAPLFPRQLVKNAINETIASLYPTLWGTGETTFTFQTNVSTYALPAGAKGVLSVHWQDFDEPTEWHDVRRYDVDPNASTAVFPTGASITIKDFVVVGRTVKVVYLKQPTALSSASDVFTTVTGLPASCEDLVRLGASYRMVMLIEAPHLAGMSAEADFSQNVRPAGAAANLSRYLLQNYQLRLQQEENKLNALYPVRIRYSF